MIKQNEFITALSVAASFAGADKPGLHVVHFDFTGRDTLRLVATAAHSLVLIELEVNHTVPVGTKFSIPLQMIDQIKEKFPIIKEGTEPLLSLASWEGALMIAGSDSFVGTGPDPKDYPDYEKIIESRTTDAAPINLNPVLLEKIFKDCAPIYPKMKDWPQAAISLNGHNTPISIEFTPREELPSIKRCVAYLMPYKQ